MTKVSETQSAPQVSHTPGPWKAIKGFGPLDDPETDQDRWCVVSAANDREYLIATIENGQPGDCLATEGHTAHLIATAPRLKEALVSLERAIDGFTRGEDYYVRDHGLALTLARKEAVAAIAEAEGR